MNVIEIAWQNGHVTTYKRASLLRFDMRNGTATFHDHDVGRARLIHLHTVEYILLDGETRYPNEVNL